MAALCLLASRLSMAAGLRNGRTTVTARNQAVARALCTLLIAGVALAGPPTSAPSGLAASRPLPRVIPWIELNYLEPQFIEPVVAGCRNWSIVSDTVCVTGNGPYVRETYELLKKRLPGLQIIPGVKTNDGGERSLLKRFDDVTGWQRVAGAVRTACTLTGSRRCVLENESAIAAYLDGRVPLDPNALAAGLRQLPPEIEYIWYPGHVGGYDRLERAAALVRIAQANLPRVALVSLGWQQTDTMTAAGGPRPLALDRATKLPLIPICFFEGRKNDWDASQVVEIGRLIGGDAVEFFAYPGGKMWPGFVVDAARAMHDALQLDRDGLARELEQTRRPTTQPSAPR